MAGNRRRGKSVVFDSLPSLVNTNGAPINRSRGSRPLAEKLSREAVREIVLVLVGLALVVWLFFGSNVHQNTQDLSSLSLGSKQLLRSDSQYIVPAHHGSLSASRDGVKKAPGDKQGLANHDLASNKRVSNVIYQYGSPKPLDLVLITVIDDNKRPRDYIEKIIENRIEYAENHGFGVLIKYASDFSKFVEDSYNHQTSWARVALAEEAAVSFPKANWFWYLADDALIMNSEFNIYKELVVEESLGPRMRRQVPIMRYENTHIRTYRNNRVQDVSLVLTQDGTQLNTDSFLFKNNHASRIWLQLWAEPLYRTFRRFQSERDALGHMMQWHTQFLVRTALVDPHYLGSMVVNDGSEESVWNEISYQQNDAVAIISCDLTTEACKREFQRKWNERKRTARAVSTPKEGVQGAKDQTQNKVQVEAQEKAQAKAEKQAAADQLAE